MKVLFWNTYRNKNINTILCSLIIENEATIVALAEYDDEIKDLIKLLEDQGICMKKYDSCCNRVVLLGSMENVELRRDSNYHTIQIINGKDILCCVHLNSQLHSGHEEYRQILIDELIHDLKNVEDEIDSENSIIVGDFNINPFDPSCIDARFFHSVPIYDEVHRKERTVAGKVYSMFYNPMWNFLGDFKKPYGTYYYKGSSAQTTFWNIFDQVIFKPSLRYRFVEDSLKILTETKDIYLIDTNGHPDKKISDHLPIVFEFKEE